MRCCNLQHLIVFLPLIHENCRSLHQRLTFWKILFNNYVINFVLEVKKYEKEIQIDVHVYGNAVFSDLPWGKCECGRSY